MYAVIDWHVTSPGDPNASEYHLRWDFWNHMASTFKDSPHVLYEICNEPSGSAVTWSVIEKYAKPLIDAIRKIDSHAIIIVGTPSWSQ